MSREDADFVLNEIHEGICGNHSGGRSLAHNVLRQGYYWPTVYEDSTDYVRKCDRRQRCSDIPRAPPQELVTLTSPWPFAIWGIDLVGPLPQGKGGVKFLVVAVDYFTKWAEVEPLVTVTAGRINDFVYKNIVCRFGLPHTLITDNGKQFDSEEFISFCEGLGIWKSFSAVYRPQANGQVEAVNKVIKHTLKKKLDALKGRWADDLPEVLWSYRTTARTSTGDTPFSLSYGCEAMASVEIRVKTFRREMFDKDINDSLLRLRLDLIDEHRAKSQMKLASYQQRAKRYFNSKVRSWEFEEGDLVLRKIVPTTKNPNWGVLGPKWEGMFRITEKIGPGTFHLEHLNGTTVLRAWNAEHLRMYYQ